MHWFYRLQPAERVAVMAYDRLQHRPHEKAPPEVQTQADAKRILAAHFGRKVG